MRIQHNIMAMNAYRNYNTNTSALSKNLEKLSSGYKINRAGDDAAGLAISEKMRAQITGLNAAQKNVKDGISLVKTAEGAMQEIQDMLNRMDYLATQSANGTYDDPVDRYNLQKEVNQLRSEINRIADSANFNGIKLLDGSLGASNTAALDSITSTVVAGADASPNLDPAVSINDKFATAASNSDANPDAFHVETGNAQQDPKFSIDLTGVTATISTGSQTFSITVAGEKIDFTITAGSGNGNTNDYGASDLAALLNGKEVSIQGISFTIAADTNKLNFTMSTGETFTSAEADDLLAQMGSQVEVGSTSSDVTISGGLKHHDIDDITKPIAEVEGPQNSGIDLTLDKDIVSNGSKLTLGGSTFVFKTQAGDDPATETGEILIDVSGVAEDKQIQEAVILMSNKATDGAIDDLGGNGKFQIRASGTDTIHIEQLATDTANHYTTRDELLDAIGANFQKCTGGEDTKGGVDVAMDESKFQLGDRVKIGDTTYVLAEQTDATAAEDATEKAVSFADLKSAVMSKISEAVGDKYEVKASDTGIEVRAKAHGDDDAEAALKSIQTKIDEVFSTIKSSSGSTGLNLQIGDTSDSFNQLNVKVGDMHTYAMGSMADAASADAKQTVELGADGKPLSIANIDISTADGAHSAIDVIKGAINYVSSIRGDLGATQNRLEHTANNLSVMAENIQDAESTIRDTDIAEEMMSYTKNNILVQSAQAMLAQANAVPQGVLQLLG